MPDRWIEDKDRFPVRTLAVWPALLVCGGSFALVQFLTANFHGPWLVDVAGGVVSLVCLALFLPGWPAPYTSPAEAAAQQEADRSAGVPEREREEGSRQVTGRNFLNWLSAGTPP